MKTNLVPVFFEEMNERERGEFQEQLRVLKEMYGEIADFRSPIRPGEPVPEEADALVFPLLIFAAFRHDDIMKEYQIPFLILTSRFGTIEMWDWEIVTYLRELGCQVYAPYSVEMANTVIRALGIKRKLSRGARFLIFQDSPGEGKQAYLFKKFYWWEKSCTQRMEEVFGCQILYRSWKELNERAEKISPEQAARTASDWNICREGLDEDCFLRAVRLYVAIKETIDEMGGVEGVGANCLNESFYSDSVPCLAWNMLFERDHIVWACEGDTLSLLSMYIIYHTLRKPVMMTNLYPFLMGMAALAHEKISSFPDSEEPDKYALGVHCGYFGFMPRCFCKEWVLRPKVLEIVDEHACAVDCRMEEGPVTLAKIYPDFRRISLIKATLEDYVQYPGSDCRNGALIRYEDGFKVMEELSSHHSLIISGDAVPMLRQVAKIFGWVTVEM